MSSAGKWELKHWSGGHPVWCQLYYDGKEILQGIHHQELLDLQFVIGRAINEVRRELGPDDQHEMD